MPHGGKHKDLTPKAAHRRLAFGPFGKSGKPTQLGFLSNRAGILPERFLGPIGRGLQAGSLSLEQFFKNPGGINPQLSQAIAPLLALNSESIQRQTGASLAQAQGGLARSGLGSSGIKGALEAAIERAGTRDIATARQQAILQSEQLRRSDLETILETMMFQAGQVGGKKAQQRQIAADSRNARRQASSGNLSGIISGIGGILGALGASGALSGAGAGVAVAASDEKLKFNLRPYEWEWGNDAERVGLKPGDTTVGLLAQDVEALWPDAVVERDGYKAVNYQLVAARLATMINESLGAR